MRGGVIEVRSKSRSIYLQLRNRIIKGDLAPMTKLKISLLAEELGTNTSAVREALSRLTAEHLVEARDQIGFRVAPISLTELDDLTANRIEIETSALIASIRHGDDAWEKRVRAARSNLAIYEALNDPSGGAEAHDAFHTALVSNCNSVTLSRIRHSLYELTERYRWVVFDYSPRQSVVAMEHDFLTETALARDTHAAAAALAAHIRQTADLVREALAKQVGE